MVEQWQQPIPSRFYDDTEAVEYFRGLTLFLDNLTREDGIIAEGEASQEVVLTHSEKLDLIYVTASINLDYISTQVASNKSAIEGLKDSLPAYTISNDGTSRTFNTDDALGSISVAPTQAEVENIRDAVLAQADVLATVIRDLANKELLGD